MSKKTASKQLTPPTHCYIGRLPCGCILASVYDLPDMGRYVSKMIRDGLAVGRVPLAEAKVVWECVHKAQQLQMEVK